MQSDPKGENLNSSGHRLADYPRLADWFLAQEGQPPPPQERCASLLFATCEAMSQSGHPRVNYFLKSASWFVHQTADLQIDYQELEQRFSRLGVSFPELMGDMGELSIQCHEGQRFQKLVCDLANGTHLAVYRFLSAWTALNQGQLELCIEECEKVDLPSGQLATLHGQALLESGYLEESLEVLQMATKIAPYEILAWFQLAKAAHVAESYAVGWPAVLECYQIAPESPEILLMMGMMALLPDAEQKDMALARNKLVAMLPDFGSSADLVEIIILLSFRTENRAAFALVVQHADWAVLKQNWDWTKRMSGILREVARLNWHDLASQLLDRLTP